MLHECSTTIYQPLPSLDRSERLRQLLLAQKHLGRILPLWGVIEKNGQLICECQGKVRGCKPGKHPGKHPRFRKKVANAATADPKKLIRWFKKYPYSNWGVLTGERVILIDADTNKPEKGNGVTSLTELEQQTDTTIPATITVFSGSGNGAKHLYFIVPEGFSSKAGNDIIPGVDFKAHNQYAVAPGSRHISGYYYQFAENFSPDAVPVAVLPNLLLEKINQEQQRSIKTPVIRSETPRMASTKAERLKTLPPPGKRYSDKRVLKLIHHHPIAGPLFRNELETIATKAKPAKPLPANPSKRDMLLCNYLAFYSCHHLDQALDLFRKSSLHRPKFDSLVDSQKLFTYAEWTMRTAFLNNPGNYKPKPKKSKATGAAKGRKPSAHTLSILELYLSDTSLTAKAIANQLQLKPDTIRRVLCNYRQGRYQHQSVTQCRSTLYTYSVSGCNTRRDSLHVLVDSSWFLSCKNVLPVENHLGWLPKATRSDSVAIQIVSSASSS